MPLSCQPFFYGLALLTSAFLVSSLELVAAAGPKRGKGPVLATSADDTALQRRLLALSSNVRPEEARDVAYVAYTTGRELAREWRVVWPPGLQNFFVHRGARKGGLCFQWASELARKLNTLKLQTLKLHWVESYLGISSEHNVVVVTATGQPFHSGILLDNWRYSGRLAWSQVTDDPDYEWKENQSQLLTTLKSKTVATP